jgi:xanthine dehydrogenase accessory factor
MMTRALTRRAQELAAQGAAFVTATVVRVQHPTSVEPGSVALVHGDGTIEGFVGGVCAEHSVRLYSLKAIESGEPVLLRILPDGPEGSANEDADAGQEVSNEDGTVTVQNPCLSGGAIEVFLEPVLPAPRVLVVGDTPIASALRSLGPELDLEIVAADGGGNGISELTGGELALVVAAHGRDEVEALRRGLEANLPYVGLVASRKRGAAMIEELRADGVTDQLLDALETPAGIEISARTSAEIALSILAQIVSVRRGDRTSVSARVGVPAPPTTAVDPICGMTVVVVADTPSVQYEDETIYFCCAGCKGKFEAQHEHAIAAS